MANNKLDERLHKDDDKKFQQLGLHDRRIHTSVERGDINHVVDQTIRAATSMTLFKTMPHSSSSGRLKMSSFVGYF